MRSDISEYNNMHESLIIYKWLNSIYYKYFFLIL